MTTQDQPYEVLVVRTTALVALTVSTALFLDALRPLPSFCEVGSGCDLLRQSVLGRVGRLPTPALGMLGYAAVFAFSFGRVDRWRALAAGIAMVGAGVGIALVTTQLVSGVVCRLCVLVDVCAIACGAGGWSWRRHGLLPWDRLPLLCWASVGAASVALPAAWSLARPEPNVPTAVSALWQAGALNVVEVTDFDCAPCRRAHASLRAALAENERPLHLVRLVAPSSRSARGREAARVEACAVALGRGDATAEALFAAFDAPSASPSAIAVAAGVDPQALAQCLSNPASGEVVDRAAAAARPDPQRRPTVWIADRALVGERGESEYASAIAQTPSGGHANRGWGAGWAPLALVVLCTGGLFLEGWRRRPLSAGVRGFGPGPELR